MSPSTLTFLAVALTVAIALAWILRSGRIREKYVALWIIIGLGTIVLALWPGLLNGLTTWFGFVLPANLLFFLAILLLLGVCLHLSYEASKLEEETRVLAEEVALLNARVDALQGPDSAPIEPN